MSLICRILSRLFSLLPLPAARWLGRGFGRLLGGFSSRKREIQQRISACLECPPREARRIYWRMYACLGMTVVEFLRLPHMADEELRDQLTFADPGRIPPHDTQFLLLVAHTGNWEWLAAATPLLTGFPLHVVVKELRPPSLNAWVLQARGRWGSRFIDRRGSAKTLLRILKSGDPIGFVLDQNAKQNWGVFVDFFGQPACTSDGLAQLAALSGLPTLPVFCARQPDHRLQIEIGEWIPPPPDRSEAAILAHTQACTQCIEEFIRRHPDQWIWMHRRWRTQPLTA